MNNAVHSAAAANVANDVTRLDVFTSSAPRGVTEPKDSKMEVDKPGTLIVQRNS